MPPPTTPAAKFVLCPTAQGSEAISAIRNLVRRGEYLAAYDAAEQAEGLSPSDRHWILSSGQNSNTCGCSRWRVPAVPSGP
jgi:hypothetical protein